MENKFFIRILYFFSPADEFLPRINKKITNLRHETIFEIVILSDVYKFKRLKQKRNNLKIQAG